MGFQLFEGEKEKMLMINKLAAEGLFSSFRLNSQGISISQNMMFSADSSCLILALE